MNLPAGRYHVTEPPTWAGVLKCVDEAPRGDTGLKELRVDIAASPEDELSTRRAKRLGHTAYTLDMLLIAQNYGIHGFLVAEGRDFVVRIEAGTPDDPGSPATAHYEPFLPSQSPEDWRENPVK